MEKSNLVAHALKELYLAYKCQPELLEGVDLAAVLRAVHEFSQEGHSGGSAPYGIASVAGKLADEVNKATADVTATLLSSRPLAPLTGQDSEWLVHDFENGPYAQNVRCGRVFKRRDGTAYDSEAVVFRDPDGSCWNVPGDSWRDVTFPYVPSTRVEGRFAS